MDRMLITEDGATKLEAELKKLKVKDRPEIIKSIATAREQGDLSENAEYHSAREKQGFIEGRIIELEDMLARAEIVKINSDSDVIRFGATVIIMDEEDIEQKFQITSQYEALLEANKISVAAPIAKELVGKKIGDIIEVNTPNGSHNYKIVDMHY